MQGNDAASSGGVGAGSQGGCSSFGSAGSSGGDGGAGGSGISEIQKSSRGVGGDGGSGISGNPGGSGGAGCSSGQDPFGCSRCRWSTGSCLSCNPVKTERSLARQVAAAATAAEELATAAAAAGQAPPLEEPGWEAVEEPQAVLHPPPGTVPSDDVGMEVDEQGGEEEPDPDDWEMVPEDVELMAAAFAELHN